MAEEHRQPGEAAENEYLANFREHWREHLCHASLGFFAGVACTQGQAAGGSALMAMCVARQMGGYWEKKDTLSIDLAWYVGSFAAGLAAGWVANLVR